MSRTRWAGRAMRWADGGRSGGDRVRCICRVWPGIATGTPALPSAKRPNALLDEFMPEYEVAERHHVRVAAPADITSRPPWKRMLQKSKIIRGIFEARALVAGADPDEVTRPRGSARANDVARLGRPGRESRDARLSSEPSRNRGWPTSCSAPCRVMTSGPFASPATLRSSWTLRADPVSPRESIFRTETRVTTTRSNRASQVPMVLGPDFRPVRPHPARRPDAPESRC